ncbi:integrase family protein [Gemmobacter fulvus]|uniref:Integrase family protein n=1 Tax=Gemmobacter fulvus TaxID=2840474 RepID=A0A975P636_9RHOB|nr:integrase family protein [Gemmobacter fulvus]MBT9247777.1 integrase family protein [Gemmobacter fulvus]QWK90032.1 integrase family protein [Gemmobacter fulvus]
MKRQLSKLSAKDVADAMSGKLETGRLSDGGGLYLRVRTGGSCQWAFVSGKGSEKRSEVSLGAVATLADLSGSLDPQKRARRSLEEARQKAAGLRQKLAQGQLPAALVKRGRAEAKVPNLRDVMDKYITLNGLEEGSKAKIEAERVYKSFYNNVLEWTKSDKLNKISRHNADAWATERLEQVSRASVMREITVWKAAFNKWIKAKDSNMKNPFDNLELPKKKSFESEIDKRSPMEKDMINKLIDNMSDNERLRELKDLFVVLTYTGARVSEITGLRVVDVNLNDDVSFISIIPHAGRRLKTEESKRSIPIFEPIRDIFERRTKTNNEYIFESYARSEVKASQAIMRQIRKVTKDKKIVAHSLRHAMSDYLRINGVTKDAEDLMLGHKVDSIAMRSYGSAKGRVEFLNKSLSGVIDHYLK